MREHEVQLVEMRLFADFWNLVDLDPGHSVNLTLPDDSVVPMTIGDVPDYPDVAQAWTKFMRCMIVALAGSLFFSGPLATWFVRLSQKIGVDILKERHERGAMLVSAAVLAGEIDAHNAAEFAAELAERYPTMAADRVARATIAERVALGLHVPYAMAGIAYPWRLEQTHAMLIGTTGAGKTTQLRKLVTEARSAASDAWSSTSRVPLSKPLRRRARPHPQPHGPALPALDHLQRLPELRRLHLGRRRADPQRWRQCRAFGPWRRARSLSKCA
jgi:hypothetical protein